MPNQGPERKLEAFKIFPYVAWVLILLFAMFVYKITMELKATAAQLEETSSSLERTSKGRTNDITTDFER